MLTLSFAPLAKGACTPPIGTSDNPCQCQHPVIENGILKCGPSYCGDKKCMPNGSCCETEKYCSSSENGIQCCSETQTCDTTKGCVEGCSIENCIECDETKTSCKICADGYTLMEGECYQPCSGGVYVDNYTSQGVLNGKICCELKADDSFVNASGYYLVGAIDGVCCGAYKQATMYCSNSASIMVNGGVAFCATEHSCDMGSDCSMTATSEGWYENPGRYCTRLVNWTCQSYNNSYYCNCADVGQPGPLCEEFL